MLISNLVHTADRPGTGSLSLGTFTARLLVILIIWIIMGGLGGFNMHLR